MKHLNYLVLLITGLVLVCFCNADVLQMAQERSLFMQGGIFWHDCMRNVGGLLQWAGCGLTQLFFYPWLGGSLLVLLWVACYFLLCRIVTLPQSWQWLLLIPCFLLMASVIDLGYWIYYLKQPGYFGRETLGLLSVLLLLQWPTPQTSNSHAQRFGWLFSVLALACYPLLGWYAVLALGLQALRSLTRRDWISFGIALLLVLIGPSIIARQYTTLRLADAWTAGFPLIAHYTTIAWSLILPFILLKVSMALLILSPLYSSHLRNLRFLPFVGLFTLVGYAAWSNEWNHNYHAEIRMVKNLKEYQFEDILKEMKEAPEGPTRQMVCFKNIALLHLDRLGDAMFQYENIGPAPVASDSLEVHMVQTCAPLLYLYHGMTNDATHWAVESCVEQGPCVEHLRTLTFAALINGESRLARKYLDMLSLVPFQSAFVQRYYGLALNPDWIDDYQELQLMRELHRDVPHDYMSDDGNCEFRIYRRLANHLGYSSPRTIELAFNYALMLKDYRYIWPQLYEYAAVHKGGEFPIIYQEAIYLGCKIDPEKHPFSGFNFAPMIEQRFNQFHTIKPKKNNHSYWWFYSNCSNVTTY